MPLIFHAIETAFRIGTPRTRGRSCSTRPQTSAVAAGRTAPMRILFTDTHNLAEGAGAAAFAAALQERDRLRGKRVAVIQTGGNIEQRISASDTVTIRAAWRRITSSARGSGTRTASPSAIVSAELVATGRPAAKDSA